MPPSPDLLDNAHSLCPEALIWDDHAGFEVTPDMAIEPQIRPWRDAGVDYLSISIGFDARDWRRTVANIAAIRHALPRDAPYTRLVSSVAEANAARAEGKMAITFDIEGMNALNERIEMVQFYYDLGVRHMNFAYNVNNAAGSGCHDTDTGLTAFGATVIDEMNRVGMVVDCTHTGYRTTMQAMERSSAPVMFTHSNPRALVDHGRNIRDDQIVACAQTGGVIGINGINLFLGERTPQPETVARHIAHVAELTGPEHVSLALDYALGLGTGDPADDATTYSDNFALSPEYWPASEGYEAQLYCVTPAQIPLIVAELLRIGFSPDEIRGILGENVRRVVRGIWR